MALWMWMKVKVTQTGITFHLHINFERNQFNSIRTHASVNGLFKKKKNHLSKAVSFEWLSPLNGCLLWMSIMRNKFGISSKKWTGSDSIPNFDPNSFARKWTRNSKIRSVGICPNARQRYGFFSSKTHLSGVLSLDYWSNLLKVVWILSMSKSEQYTKFNPNQLKTFSNSWCRSSCLLAPLWLEWKKGHLYQCHNVVSFIILS